MVAARFKRDVGRCAFGFFTRHAQRVHFCMRLTGAIVKTFADDFALIDNHAADARIRMGGKSPARRQFNRARHVHFIVHSLIL